MQTQPNLMDGFNIFRGHKYIWLDTKTIILGQTQVELYLLPWIGSRLEFLKMLKGDRGSPGRFGKMTLLTINISWEKNFIK